MAEKKKNSKKNGEVAEDIKETAEKEENTNEEAVENDSEPTEAEILKNQLLTVMAEYDNFKKRTVKEKERIYSDSTGATVAQLLPVIDNLERALASFTETDNEFYKGFELVLKQTKEIFEKMGVSEIASVGESFNPEFHSAVMHIEDDEAGENVVVEEFQKGYMYKDKVIRYAMVKVAN